MSGRLLELAPGLCMVQRGWLSANHFIFRDDQGATLLDSGYIAQVRETMALLRQAGVDPHRLRRIISSHLHCDHVGANALLQRLSGCPIATSRIAGLAAQRRDAWAAWPAYYGQDYRFFPVHETLRQDQRVALGGLEWLVLELPGHAAGQLGLFCPDTGWLISADAAWGGDFGVLTCRIEGWDAPLRQRDTLRRLLTLPVTTLLPGHGPLQEDGPASLERCLQRVESFIRQPRRMAEDQVRKILLYHLLMKGPVEREALWRFEQGLPWLPETCRTWLEDSPRLVFERMLDELLARGLATVDAGRLRATLDA